MDEAVNLCGVLKRNNYMFFKMLLEKETTPIENSFENTILQARHETMNVNQIIAIKRSLKEKVLLIHGP